MSGCKRDTNGGVNSPNPLSGQGIPQDVLTQTLEPGFPSTELFDLLLRCCNNWRESEPRVSLVPRQFHGQTSTLWVENRFVLHFVTPPSFRLARVTQTGRPKRRTEEDGIMSEGGNERTGGRSADRGQPRTSPGKICCKPPQNGSHSNGICKY